MCRHNRVLLMTGACVLGSVVNWFADAANAADMPKRPNVLFVFTDDHAVHAMSCYGLKINTTPNLDRTAREWMRFQNCFCTNSILRTQPSRHSHRQAQSSERL